MSSRQMQARLIHMNEHRYYEPEIEMVLKTDEFQFAHK